MKFCRTIGSLIIIIFLFNACQKEYSFERGTLPPAGNWQFSDGSTNYSGNIDSVYQTNAGSLNELFIVGKTANGVQSFQLHLFSDSFKIGTYKVSSFQSSFSYNTTAKTLYTASQLIGEFVVNVTAIDNTNIEGTFSGTAKDSSGNLVQLTNGKFKSSFAGGSINTPASGALGDSAGKCKPIIINGAYAQGIKSNNNNTIQVQVNVAAPGPFTLSTNTVNGLSFSTSGTFSTAGQQNVLLNASGTPSVSGDYLFTLKYGNSQCDFTLKVLGVATGTLGSNGNDCTSFTFAGTYKQGTEFNTGNTVTIQVNATTAGAYHISTNTINNVSFDTSGIFSATGLQTVTLVGKGTPLNSGVQNFSVTYINSTCNFPLTFISGVAPSDDYFPLSANSNWTYNKVGGTPSDSITNQINNYSTVIAGVTYNSIKQTITSSGSVLDSFYYRKPGGNYYQFINFEKSYNFDQYVAGEYIFLKDNVAANETWNSPTFSGTIRGLAVSGYAKMTLLAKNVAVTTIPGFNFPDVLKVKYEYFLTGNPNPLFT
ncbi:MAG: hypothetical protein ABI325_00785, partial [Ginsengibacter sp.]